ncbi:MAG TPA: hypothetical protein VFS00_10300, partial [Polyangiaceae bacterium]|nr:hypothetical protein [Polyangiaceae bacterium]
MKPRLWSNSLYALAALGLVGGCTAADDAERRRPSSLRQSAAALSSRPALPPRPALSPGESNWRPRAPASPPRAATSACPSLSTVDLNSQTPADLVTTLLGSGPAA